MKNQNRKSEPIKKVRAKGIACIVCLSFFTICSIVAMIIVFIFCKKIN